jgi:hypothetical protein
MTTQFAKYSLYYSGNGYDVTFIEPTQSLTSGTLKIYLKGNVFSGQTEVFDDIVIRPNDREVNRVFNEDLDEVQRFLLNRNVVPVYTAIFKLPGESDDGTFYIQNKTVTWPLYGSWNLDILTNSFTSYLTTLNTISVNFDEFQTNLVSRFLTTDSLKEFDTSDQKVEKVLQIYGRSFDETKKFINALAYMNSVNYNTGNDIPSQLLKNLAQTLGWSTNISPITNDDFLNSVFGQKNIDASVFSGVGKAQTPDELNYQYYKNLILNSAYLFKSKGTRKSIETLMRLIGAPDALVEFNEYVYVADQKINMSDFETQYASISGGTYSRRVPVLEPGNIIQFQGSGYTGFTTVTTLQDVTLTSSDYPVDSQGFPSSPVDNDSYYFQMGSGWFESTPQHRSPEQVDLTNSVFTGNNPNYQTKLAPFTYGQEYLDVYRRFPYTDLGFNLRPVVDNNKSWVDNEDGNRSNLDGQYNALYFTNDEKLVINVKNVDLFLNPSQGLLYDVWHMSRQFNYPIPNEGLNYTPPTYCDPNPTTIYPNRGGVDNTVIKPKPNSQTFFEFAQTFWKNTINVRNRQFATNGKTGGYPTLESIFWRYLESESLGGVQNDNFTYKTMIEYVNGLGDYWVRLVEQMIPASTIWNTGVKLENSIFHRQKFVWRRQRGCDLVPIICKPCKFTGSIFISDCPVQSTRCPIYPGRSGQLGNFTTILEGIIQDWETNNTGVGICDYNTIQSQWFVDLDFNGTVLQHPFFIGTGYYNYVNQSCLPATPCLSYVPNDSQRWLNALDFALSTMINAGYDYRYETSDGTVTGVSDPKVEYVRIWNTNCSDTPLNQKIIINVGIIFSISCQN